MENAGDRTPARRALWGCLIALTMVTAFVAYSVGRAHQAVIEAVRRQDEQIARIARFLDQHPGRYDSLSFNVGPPPDKFHLEGEVRTQEDLDALQAELVRMFEEERADYILEVSVRAEAEREEPSVVEHPGDDPR